MAISGTSKKTRNANRTKGYWLQLHQARGNRPGHELIWRSPTAAVNYPSLQHVGSAAHRRLLARKR